MKNLLLILLSAALAACSSTSNLPSLPKVPAPTGKRLVLTGTPEWKTAADASKTFGSNVTVTGNTVDLKGNTLDGSKLKRPSSPNDEGAVGLTIRAPGLTVRNGSVYNVPGGIVVKTWETRFRNLVFTKPGEDFLSTVGESASGLVVDNCAFHNTRSGDKSLQANCAVDLKVEDSLIVGGITGARVQKTSYNQKNVKAAFTNTTFLGNETGINVAGDTTVTVTNCSFSSGKKWVISEGSGAKVVAK